MEKNWLKYGAGMYLHKAPSSSFILNENNTVIISVIHPRQDEKYDWQVIENGFLFTH